MNVYINYQFNFGQNTSSKMKELSEGWEQELFQQLLTFMEQVPATRLKENLFKLLMQHLVQEKEKLTTNSDLKDFYVLLEFLKVIGEFQKI